MNATRCLHKGYHIASTATETDDGRFQARVAVYALGSERTQSQQFLDFDAFDSEAEATAYAIEKAKLWVDSHVRH